MAFVMGSTKLSAHASQTAVARPAVAKSMLRVRAQAVAGAPAKSKYQRPDATGRYGKFGGKYVPETLIPALEQLEVAYAEARADPAYQVRHVPMKLCAVARHRPTNHRVSICGYARVRCGVRGQSWRPMSFPRHGIACNTC